MRIDQLRWCRETGQGSPVLGKENIKKKQQRQLKRKSDRNGLSPYQEKVKTATKLFPCKASELNAGQDGESVSGADATAATQCLIWFQGYPRCPKASLNTITRRLCNPFGSYIHPLSHSDIDVFLF